MNVLSGQVTNKNSGYNSGLKPENLTVKAFGRLCGEYTAGRQLLDNGNVALHISPRHYNGIDVLDWDSCYKKIDRFHDGNNRAFNGIGLPEVHRKLHHGHPVEDTVDLLSSIVTKTYDGAVTDNSGNRVESQKRPLSDSSDTSLAPRKQQEKVASTISENSATYDTVSTKGEGAPRHLDYNECVFYIDGLSFAIDQSGCLQAEELTKNAAAIAEQLSLLNGNEWHDFEFVRFLSESQNNTVSLVKNNTGEKFIIKHLHEAIWGKIQSYPNVFNVLRSVRQATLDKDHLNRIGTDIGVMAVTSNSKFACVEVKGLPHKELAFFKMVPYVENAVTFADAVNNQQLQPEVVCSTVIKMARYLARLHTDGADIILSLNNDGKINGLSVAHMHSHPHGYNWLVSLDDPNNIYLIDWDLYCDYVFLSDHHTNMSIYASVKACLQCIPDDYRETFKETYLNEWKMRAHGLDDQKKGLSQVG